MNTEEMPEWLSEVKELGLSLIDFSYANQYADMGDMGDIEEFKDEIRERFNKIFGGNQDE